MLPDNTRGAVAQHVQNAPIGPPRTDDGRVLNLTPERAGGCACFFDFDGTLAPIQDDPEGVQLVPGAVEALTALAATVRRVAIVSARPADFLRRHFPDLPQISLFGLYGLESQVGDGPIVTHPQAAPYQPAMAELADAARAQLPPGVLVEYKRLSVALHYRAVPHLRPEVDGWAERMATEHGLRAQAGRMVIELKPPVDRNKGSVVREQTADVAGAWFFGDDLSDLRAFAALDERVAADPGFAAVRVAIANPESGQALLAAADLGVNGPEEVPALLHRLIGALDED